MKTVALVRGDALNSFETAAWGRLTGFRVLGVGSTRPRYQLDGLPFEHVALRQVDAVLGRKATAVARRLRPDVEGEALLGLDKVLDQVAIVHAAETAIPWSEQSARHTARTGRPLVLTCWETIPFLHEESARLRERKARVRDATTLFQATTMRARYALLEEGVEPERVVVVPPSIETAHYATAERVDRERLNLLLPGRVIREKGAVETVRAIAHLPAHVRARVVLQLAGTGDALPRVHAAATRLGLAEQIEVLGHTPHATMNEVFARADLVLLPSLPTPYWEEQFGMVLVEAMASGCPVLATDSGAIGEVVGEAGDLVPPYDVEALTAGLQRLVEDADRRRTLGGLGRVRAAELFDASVVARQLDELYARLP